MCKYFLLGVCAMGLTHPFLSSTKTALRGGQCVRVQNALLGGQQKCLHFCGWVYAPPKPFTPPHAAASVSLVATILKRPPMLPQASRLWLLFWSGRFKTKMHKGDPCASRQKCTRETLAQADKNAQGRPLRKQEAGQVVATKEITFFAGKANITLGLKHLAAGVYTLSFENKVIKVVKE